MLHIPSITDGITDAEARTVATLWGVARYNSELIDTLLDPDRVELEEREIDLPHTGRVRLTIIRTKPGAAISMDLTETAVRTVEGFMSMALPQREVITLYADATKGGFGSQNFWTHIGHATWRDTENSPAGRIPHYAHEVGHYYFRGSERRLVRGSLRGRPVFSKPYRPTPTQECRSDPGNSPAPRREISRNWRAWLRQVLAGPAGLCPYSLGERLFHDLYRNMDETTFRLGFRRLYLLSQNDNPRDRCDGTKLNICHVRAAFTTDVSPETAAIVEMVIARWYDGNEPYDHSFRDDIAVKPVITGRDVRIDRAYLSATGGGIPVAEVSGSRGEGTLYFNLEYSYGNDALPDYLPLQIAVHFEGDGFTFTLTYRHSQWPLRRDHSKWTHWIRLGSWPDGSLPGDYRVYAYWGGQKVAEVALKVGP